MRRSRCFELYNGEHDISPGAIDRLLSSSLPKVSEFAVVFTAAIILVGISRTGLTASVTIAAYVRRSWAISLRLDGLF